MAELDPDRVVEQVALRIAEARRARGLTQDAMAELLRMPLRNYQRIESGTQNLTVRSLVRIAVVLGVEPAAFWREPTTQRSHRRGRPKRQP